GPDGKFVRDVAGEIVKSPGMLRECRAVGWYIEEYGRAQVSINLTNFKITPVHVAFDACEEAARKYGLRVTGSELVGLVPLEAMRMAGMHYLQKQGRSVGVPERELIHIAVRSLGLDELGPFDPAEKIIEYRVRSGGKSLVAMSAREFVDELSTDSPAPGGGSVAALCGSLGAALAAMVANLTLTSQKLSERWDEVRPVALQAQTLKDWFLSAVDEDTRAFNAVMDAMRLPKKSPDDEAARAAAIQAATRRATEVPFSVLERSREVLDLAEIVVRAGNPSSVSDAGVAAICARACAEGAYLNVGINLAGIEDRAWAGQTAARAREMLQAVRDRSEALVAETEARATAG